LQIFGQFEDCYFKFISADGIAVKLALADGLYIVLLDHFTRVIGEVDDWSETRLESPLRNLMLACLGYQPKPFLVLLPQCLDSSSFLKMINSLVFEWIAIYSRSALSPCPFQSTVSLRSTSVVLNWNEPGEKCVEIMYEAGEDANDVFQVSVENRSCKQFQFEIRLSPIFLLNRFGEF
jgi:hypothetical protein